MHVSHNDGEYQTLSHQSKNQSFHLHHEGLVYLAVKTVSAESMSSGKKMEGRVNKMQYLYDGEFRDGGIDGRYVYFPVTALNFIAMGKGRDTLLHGSVCLRMQCSVGDMHMPESTAIFTMFIH